MKVKKQNYYFLLLILIVTVGVFASVNRLGFVNWDDDDNVRLNSHIQEVSLENIKYNFEHERYKSLALYSFMLDYALWELNPTPYHLHNLLLHLINIILVYFVVLILTKKEYLIALITAGLFALHPVSVEGVAWVTGRKDLLFMLFSLLSILAYIKYIKINNRIWCLLIVSALVFLASMAKIQAFVLPVIFVALDIYYKRKISGILFLEKIFLFLFISKIEVYSIGFFVFSSLLIFIAIAVFRKVNYKRLFLHEKYGIILYYISACLSLKWVGMSTFGVMLCVLVGSLILYFLIKRGVIRHFFIINCFENPKKYWILSLSVFFLFFLSFIITITDNWSQLSLHFWTDNETASFAFADRILLAGYAFVFYIKRLFLLQGFNPMVAYPDQGLSWSFENVYFINFLISLLIISVLVYIIFRNFKNNRLVVLGILIFLINISIVMHIIPIEGRIVAADRYAYSSFWGLFIVFGYLVNYVKSIKIHLKSGIVFIVCLGLAINTYSTIRVWENSYSLWFKAVEENNKNPYANNALGIAYLEIKNDTDSALIMINRALDIEPMVPEYLVDKGRVLFILDSMDSSLRCFNIAIALDSANDMAFNNRGSLRMKRMEYRNAISDFKTAIDLNDNIELYKENYSKARRFYRLDSVLFADYFTSMFSTEDKIEYIKIAFDRLIAQGKARLALEYLLIGLKLNNDDISMLQNVATIYSNLKQYDLSIRYYKQLISLNSREAEYYYFLANDYFNKGNIPEACENWSVAKLYGHAQAAKYFDIYCK